MGQPRSTTAGIARLRKELAKAKTVALDTTVFSYYYSGGNAFAPLSKVIFEATEQGEVHALASSFALAEMLVGIAKVGDAQAASNYVNLISSFPNLRFIPFDTTMASHYAAVRTTGLKPADSIHIATAQAARADLLISNDYAWRNRFAKPKLILLGEYL
jgi:predicted nucleic acid-binding protein